MVIREKFRRGPVPRHPQSLATVEISEAVVANGLWTPDGQFVPGSDPYVMTHAEIAAAAAAVNALAAAAETAVAQTVQMPEIQQ